MSKRNSILEQVCYKLYVDEALNGSSPVFMPIPASLRYCVRNIQSSIYKYARRGVVRTYQNKHGELVIIKRSTAHKIVYAKPSRSSISYKPVHNRKFWDGQEVTNGLGERVRILEVRENCIIASVKNLRSGMWITNKPYRTDGTARYTNRVYDLKLTA